MLPISAGFFASRATWYQVAFRCEIDADATRVLAFTFQVGREVPRSEWAARHFREF